jgi:DNA-binding transcriptional LysR family regulator
MELRHLRYFIAVAEELHFHRAAERLHVSQPPLSQQIKQLEEEVQVRLFERSKRWVRLTSAGRLFLEHARQVLIGVDGAVLAVRRTIGGERDRLSIACTPWAGYIAIPHIVSRFSEQHPNVSIDIQTLTSERQLHAVKARLIDVAFMWRSSADDDLQIDLLLAHPLVVALPVKHRLSARTYLSPRDLAGEPYVTLDPNVAPVYSQAIAEYWERTGVTRNDQHRVDQPYAVIELVAAGAGFAVVPLSVHVNADRRIVCRRLDPPLPELELTLARARGVDSPTINALLEMALPMARQQRSFLTGEGRTDSHPGSSDLSTVGRMSRAGLAGQARTSGAHQLDARSSLPDANKLTRDGGAKSIRTSEGHRSSISIV